MNDRFEPDAALIPLMTETEQLRLGIHPTHMLRDGEVYRREPKPNEEQS